MKIYSMELEDIIDALNRHLENKKSEEIPVRHFVLHKHITNAGTFKVYKNFEYTLWLINGENKYQVLIKSETLKFSEGTKSTVIKQFEVDFLTELFDILFNTSLSGAGNIAIFKDIIYGE